MLLPLVLAGGLGSFLLHADEKPPAVSLAGNGELTFTCPEPGRTYLVEWAPSPDGPWSDSWDELCGIEPGMAASATVSVPMFYRVKTPAVVQTIGVVPAVDAKALIEAHDDDPEFTILDVRSAAEFDGGHIVGAVNIDRYGPTFEAVVMLLPRDRVYLVNCLSGGRSAGAVSMMEGLGFEEVYDLGGGFNAFSGVPGNGDLIE